MIAALYVRTGGVYYGLEDVDPWDVTRDARNYPGPYPVVAHPPCERWGRYWSGGPSAKVRREKGDDKGCFAAALASVREWGGVLEHPADSSAWLAHGLLAPPRSGGWVSADFQGGWTCCVEQGHYGHRARKATWLYACRARLPSLRWGSSGRKARMDLGFHSAEERRLYRHLPKNATLEQREGRKEWLAREAEATGKEWRIPERLSTLERLSTPIPFRDLLLSIARTVQSLSAVLGTQP